MTAKKKPKRPFAFAPHKVLLNPPIRHRHTPKELRYLYADEFAVAMGVAIAARKAYGDILHQQSFKAGGGKTIEQEKALADEYKASVRDMNKQRRRGEVAPNPERRHTFATQAVYDRANVMNAYRGLEQEYSSFRPIPLGKALKVAGASGYKKLKKQLRKQPPPDEIIVVISKRALLRYSALKDCGENYHRLTDTTLKRLTRRIGEYWPVLISWQELPSGSLQLHVSGKWLKKPFGRLPWPPPMRSPTALALFLFLHGIDTRPTNRIGIRFEKLCERLGISTKAGLADANKTFNRALLTVNAHLAKLDRNAFEAVAKKKLPAGYEVKNVKNGELRFEAIPYRQHERDTEVIENYETPKHESSLSSGDESTSVHWR